MSLWPLKKAYYRTFQFVLNYAEKVLPWRKPEIVQGAGKISAIPELLKTNGKIKPIIVTDPGLMNAGIAPRAITALEEAGIPYALFDQVMANPTDKVVDTIFALYTKEQCDCFIAIGGGSSMDAAKAAAARSVRPRKSVQKLGGLFKILHRLPLFIAVPTTAGTGSETTVAAVITDAETHHKFTIMDLCLIPHYAILDPELTVGLPKHITSTTGMDALTHAIEGYLNWTYNTKESIRCAEEATVLIFKHLEAVYENGQDLEGRMQMLLASFKAGFAFTRTAVGNIHAIAHTLGGLYNTAHGLANAVILPIVLDDYGEKAWPKLAHLAELTGVATSGTVEEKAKAFIAEIYAMNERMGIQKGFDFIRDEDIPKMVQWAGAEANPIYAVPVIYSPEHFTSVIKTIRAKA